MVVSPQAEWPTLNDVERAAQQLDGIALRTPFTRSANLSHASGAEVFLKFENRQHTGSYKMRGAHVRLAQLSMHERARGVVAASAGNHAQGIAFNAAWMRIASTIVMPTTTPYCKLRSTEGYGARVILHGANVGDAFVEARRIAAAEGTTFIAAFDDPAIVAGAGTVGLEMLREIPNLDVLLVQVGGGGLIAGMACVAKRLNPAIRVVAVQTELYPALANALRDLPPPIGGATLAEGVAVAQIGALNLAMARDLVDEVVLVDEAHLEFAVHALLEDEKTVVEGAGAAGVAALLQHRDQFTGARVGIVLSGGNIDTGLLAYVISRVRMRERRVACIRVEMLDVPGGLAHVSGVVARHGANVLEVSHRRMFPDVLAKHMQLDLAVELRRPDDLHAIVQSLESLGFSATIPG